MKLRATWHSKKYDIPVVITKYLGKKEGELWFLAEFGNEKTGVPRSQLKDIHWGGQE